MSTSTTPVRLDAELTSAARLVAGRMSRSAAEQIGHWARIGRELERSGEISIVEIQKVLDGQHRYDSLPSREQAIVRAAWGERMEYLRSRLRLDQAFKAAEHDYAELDADGKVATRESANRPSRRVASRSSKAPRA